MQYFDHSTTASSDTKVMSLRLECGGAAVDAYWYLVEQMHLEEKPLCTANAGALRVHCHALCTDVDTLEKWVDAMVSTGLLKRSESGEEIYSERATSNIEAYKEKREKASSSARARWENANAKQPKKRTQSKRNADPMLTKQNKTKGFSTTRRKNPTVSDGAAAVETAPPENGVCLPTCKMPGCDGYLLYDVKTSKFRCNKCRSTFTREEAGI